MHRPWHLNAFYKLIQIEATWSLWLFKCCFCQKEGSIWPYTREGGMKRHPLAYTGRGQEGQSMGQETQDRDGRVTAIHAQNSGWNGQRRQTVSWLVKTMTLLKQHRYFRQSYMHRIIWIMNNCEYDVFSCYFYYDFRLLHSFHRFINVHKNNGCPEGTLKCTCDNSKGHQGFGSRFGG